MGFDSARRRQREDDDQEATVIALCCTDEDSGWTARLGAEGAAATATGTTGSNSGNDETPDCTVRGTAADLYLTLWRRSSPDTLTVEGDGRAFELLLERARI